MATFDDDMLSEEDLGNIDNDNEEDDDVDESSSGGGLTKNFDDHGWSTKKITLTKTP